MLSHGCMAAVVYMHAMLEPCWKAYGFAQRCEQLWDLARTPEGLAVAESKPLPSTMASLLSGPSFASSRLSRGWGEQVSGRLSCNNNTAPKKRYFDLHHFQLHPVKDLVVLTVCLSKTARQRLKFPTITACTPAPISATSGMGFQAVGRISYEVCPAQSWV